jgi:hypothetical protein
MAKRIYNKDVYRKDYESLPWVEDDVSEFLKNKKVINVETLEEVIRFWYIIE